MSYALLRQLTEISEAYALMPPNKWELHRYDRIYADAVKSKDENTVIRLLKWAAKASMPKTKVVDSLDMPLVVYHGSYSMFDSFDMSKDNESRMEHVPVGTAWFSDNEDVAKTYAEDGHVYPCFLNLQNPLTVDARGMRFSDEEYGYGVSDDEHHKGFSTGPLVRRAQRCSKDGVIIKNIEDNSGPQHHLGTDYVAFYPWQIKLACPTYYPNHRLIPLSERFFPNTDDMRF